MAIINTYKNEMRFSHKGRNHTITTKDPRNHSHVSVNAITKYHNRKYPLFSVMLRKAQADQVMQEGAKGSQEQDLQEIPNEFKDFFPEKLPKGLPP